MVDGHFCSASSIPASKVYTDNGIIEISPGSTNPKYTDDGSPFIFRTCGRDDEQGKVAADYIAAHFKNAKIAVLDDNSTYGKGIADQVRANLGKLGVPIAYNTSYTAGDKDYSALISRLKQARHHAGLYRRLLFRFRSDHARRRGPGLYAAIFLGRRGGDLGALADRRPRG